VHSWGNTDNNTDKGTDMKKPLINIIKIVPAILACFSFSKIAFAQGYVPLEPLPGIASGTPATLGAYLDSLFKIGIGVSIVLAVIMLVVAGIEYIGGASNESTKTDAKERIWGAILGLLIALGAWLLLQTINPNINTTNFGAPPVNQQQGGGAGGGGGGAGGVQ